MHRLKLIWFLALLFAGSAAAQPLSELESALADISRVRCQFTMQRHLTGVAGVIGSSGTLLLDREYGVALLQDTPFKLALIAGHDKLSERVGHGAPKVFTRKDAPAVFALADEVVQNVFNFSEESLTERFTLSYEDLGAQGYRLQLAPKGGDTLKLVKTVRLSSSANFPEELSYVSAQGDETALHFTSAKLNGAELSSKERALFD